MFAMANIGDWLHNELNKRDWSQADLSRKAGLSRAAISNLISGNRGLGKDTALSIAKAFNIPPEDVLRAAGFASWSAVETATINGQSKITKESKMEQKARERAENNPELKAVEDIIFYDWPNWDEHMEWVATAPISEIVEWADAVEKE